MILKIGWYHVLGCALAVALTASAAMSMGRVREAPLAATVLAAGRQCLPASDGWRATWISSPQALRAMMDRTRSHRLGSESDSFPVVDFDRFRVLMVEMGTRPTAGYQFDTRGVTAKVTEEIATVQITHVQPASGAMTAQVVTSPWVLIQIPLENFSEIRVVDQSDTLLVQTSLP